MLNASPIKRLSISARNPLLESIFPKLASNLITAYPAPATAAPPIQHDHEINSKNPISLSDLYLYLFIFSSFS